MAHLCPSEFHRFYRTGKHPFEVSNPPPAPKPEKPVEELGKSHENTHEKENDPEKSKDPSSNDPKKSES